MTDRRREKQLPAGYQYGDAARAQPAAAPVVGTPEHRWIADYYKNEAGAMRAAKTIASILVVALKCEGWTVFKAPELPSARDAFALLEVQDDCRVLVAWIPDWSAHEHAGDWCCRADTLASAKAEV